MVHTNFIKMRILLTTILFNFSFCVALKASEIAKYKVTSWRGCPESKFRHIAKPQISVGECAHECKIRAVCKSVGYHRLSRLCEIFSTEVDVRLKTVDRSPCVFIRRTDIEQDASWCNCTKRQVCNSLTGDCTVKECSRNRATNVDITGNRNHVGAKVKIACDDGWESSNSSAVCKPDGSWNHELACTLICPTVDSWIYPEHMPDFKIQFHLEKLNHTNAVRLCRHSNARLVRIDNEKKLSYIAGIISSCDNFRYPYWTDGSNKDKFDTTMWFSNGDPMPLGESYWQTGRPETSKSSGLMCARLQHIYDQCYRWRDAYCSEHFPFICEQK